MKSKQCVYHGLKALIGTALVGVFHVTPVPASITMFSTDTPQLIEDNSLIGVQSDITVGDQYKSSLVNDVTVTFTISSPGPGIEPWAGDYYMYLYHNGKASVLLNQVGKTSSNDPGDVGYGNPGFNNVRINDAYANDIHNFKTTFSLPTALEGNWAPDGRTDLEGSRDAMLSVFNKITAAGTWSLVVADISPTSAGQLTSWSLDLDITAVPEPSTCLNGIAALLLFGMFGWKSKK
jgi:hypothetical protein